MTHLDATIRAANRAKKSYGMFVAERYERNGYRPECGDSATGKEEYRKCVICGNYIPYGKNGNSKTCGEVCSLELNRRRNAQLYRARKGISEAIVKQCATCGKEFTTTKNNQVYCNRECQSLRYRVRSRANGKKTVGK